jgi:hypothetical protein
VKSSKPPRADGNRCSAEWSAWCQKFEELALRTS